MNGTRMVSWHQGLTVSQNKRPRENIELSNKFKTNDGVFCVNFSHNVLKGMGYRVLNAMWYCGQQKFKWVLKRIRHFLSQMGKNPPEVIKLKDITSGSGSPWATICWKLGGYAGGVSW